MADEMKLDRIRSDHSRFNLPASCCRHAELWRRLSHMDWREIRAFGPKRESASSWSTNNRN